MIHSIFNVVATLILLPFSKGLEKLAYMTIKEDRQERAGVPAETEEELKKPTEQAAERSVYVP